LTIESLVKAEADYVQPALMRILTEAMKAINPSLYFRAITKYRYGVRRLDAALA
jgi:hypothetical protein